MTGTSAPEAAPGATATMDPTTATVGATATVPAERTVASANAVTAGAVTAGVASAGVASAGVAAASVVRVAVVGLGWAGRSIWLPRLHEHAAFEVVAAVDPDPGARAELLAGGFRDGMSGPDAAGFGAGVSGPDAAGRPVVWDHPEALRRSAVDLAVVAVPNHLHSSVAARLLNAGVPVFLEKPVCLSTSEADTLAAAEVAGGATLLAGSASRYRADTGALYDLVGELGTIRHVEVSWVRARGVPDAGGWFTQRQLAGGGALVDLGWHLLDAVAPIVGVDGFIQVVGTVSNDFVNNAAWGAAWRHDDPVDSRAGGDVEDTVRAFLVAGNGISVALRASWASHEKLDATVIRVEGSAGTAELRCTFGFSPNRRPGSTLSWTRDGRTSTVDVPEEKIGTEYRRQLDRLPALLADPDQRGRAVAQSRSTISAIERIYDSASSARSGIPAARAAI